MPSITCLSCGHVTNSSISNYTSDMEPDFVTPKECFTTTRCYARIINNEWVRGCGYYHTIPIMQKLADSLINRKGV